MNSKVEMNQDRMERTKELQWRLNKKATVGLVTAMPP